MNFLTKSFVLIVFSFLLVSLCAGQRENNNPGKHQTEVLRDVPRIIDVKARYLFYISGYIVRAEDIRPTSPQYGVYEYEKILDALKPGGFVIISEARQQSQEIEPYAIKVAEQVRRLLKAGVPPQNITVAGASQGGWMAMLVSTYLKNRDLRYVVIGACGADDGILKLIDLHGNVLFIAENTDRFTISSCRRYRADATGLSDYKEVVTNTGQKHGFLYRPMKEWIEPTIAWANGNVSGEDERTVSELERRYRDAVFRGDVKTVSKILADDFIATSSRGEIRTKAKEIEDMEPSPDFKMEAYTLDDMNVRVFGITAIVTGRATLQVAYKGKSNTNIFRYTRIYVKREGLWQAIAQQLTRLPQQE